MKEQLHTIQLTRRELGLVHHIMSIKYTDIDDNVKFGNFDVIDEEAFWELVDSMPSVQYRLRETVSYTHLTLPTKRIV